MGAGGGSAPVSWVMLAREVDVFIPQGDTMAEAYRLRTGDLRRRAVVVVNHA